MQQTTFLTDVNTNHHDFGEKIGGARKDLASSKTFDNTSHKVGKTTTLPQIIEYAQYLSLDYADISVQNLEKFAPYCELDQFLHANHDAGKQPLSNYVVALATLYNSLTNDLANKPRANSKRAKIFYKNYISIFSLFLVLSQYAQNNKADRFFELLDSFCNITLQKYTLRKKDTHPTNYRFIVDVTAKAYLSLPVAYRGCTSIIIQPNQDDLQMMVLLQNKKMVIKSPISSLQIATDNGKIELNSEQQKDVQTALIALINDIKPKIADEMKQPTAKKSDLPSFPRSSFVIWKRIKMKDGQKPYFISLAKKFDKISHELAQFDDKNSAFAYLNSEDGLNKLQTQATNYKKSLLSIKTLHLANSNDLRNGKNHRQGKDISTEEFAKTFGFRAVEFGNWVSQGKNYHDRADFINKAYDAFCDLAELLGKPKDFIGLQGNLAIAFGSRGKGTASAHYERQHKVINLTKTKGNGTLAHEWFHAYDHFINYSSGLKDFFSSCLSITNTPLLKNNTTLLALQERSYKLDCAKAQNYFSTNAELFARFFESCVHYKLQKQGLKSEFLNNHNTEHWAETDFYPYVNSQERNSEHIEGDFNNFLQVFKLV